MKLFSTMIQRLDQSNKTNEKLAALVEYFREAPAQDKTWAIALFSDRRPRRTVTTTLLRLWAAECAALPLWLFEDSYHVVGDLAETIALVLPPPQHDTDHSLHYWMHRIRALEHAEEREKKADILDAWNSLDYQGRFIFNKLLTGNWRIGVSGKMVAKALSMAFQLEENVVLHRLSGKWSPDEITFEQLVLEQNAHDDHSKPYPFCLAYPLETAPEALGDIAEWMAEFKWDGIRGQLIRRAGELFVWSRGEELVTPKYPEYEPLRLLLPDGVVLDGEILAWSEERPLSFGVLQTRIGRKTVTKKLLTDTPVIFMAYDLLEYEGMDIRTKPLAERRALLAKLIEKVGAPSLRLSPLVDCGSWVECSAIQAAAGRHGAEGLMLKRKDSGYKTGRKRGDWWKWKLEPLTVDAIMIYAQQGHGRRANLFTDFTFAVWQGEALTPFTKSYSGLTDAEFREVDAWIRRHTVERFGPVRAVKPELVFEIAFEGIQKSNRHKSGIALRFPRISRWRKDKTAAEANHLEDLLRLL